MTDRNGRIIKAGDIVRVSGAFFAHDNALYFVEHEPGGEDWSGSDYALIRISKNGKISTAKYKNAFWPLCTFTNSRAKRLEADSWNAEHAVIEVIDDVNPSGIIAYFEEKIAAAEQRKKRYTYSTEDIARENRFIEYYNGVLSHINGDDFTDIKPGKIDISGIETDFTRQVFADVERLTGKTIPELSEQPEATEPEPENTSAPETADTAEETPTEPNANSHYYCINEEAARRAKEMMSFSEYKTGSKTAEYRSMVDRAEKIAEAQKKRVDIIYHEKIDRYLDCYCRRLAENFNRISAVNASCPSILICGGGNFPVRKKQKQNERFDAAMREYGEIEGILEKIKGIGTGGIMSDDKRALEKLKLKLEKLEEHQELMKAANAAIRLKDTAKGDAKLKELGYSVENIKKLREPDFCGRIGYPAYELQNNNANIHRIQDRIKQLEKEQERAASGQAENITGDGWTLTENAEEMRIQFIFDGKPDADIRTLLKSNGFRWAPSQGAWQRLLNNNGRYAAKRIMEKLNA